MSLLAGGLISGSNLVLGDALIPLPGVSSLVRDKQPVTLGIRQEAVKLSAEEPSTNRITLPAEVESFSPIMSIELTRSISAPDSGAMPDFVTLEMDIRVGKSVRARLDPEQLYFFDTNSGLRI